MWSEMKRCPKCSATYGPDAAWCPLDGTQLHDDRDDLHTLGEDVDAGHTLRDLPASPLTGGGSLTMGWEIPEIPTTAPGAVVPGPKPSSLTMGWEIPEIPETPTTMPGAVIPGPKPMPEAPKPSSLTMGWEIPELPDAQPRTTPTQLAAAALPSTLPGVKPDRLKAATLPPAAPRMTPKSLAAALAKAPAPQRPEPIQTPTSVSVPTPEPEPPRFVGGLAETEPFEQLDPEPATFVAPSRISEPIDPPTFATPPLDVADVEPIPPPIAPPALHPGSSAMFPPPALGPPPNLVPEPRRGAQSKPPLVRRLITEPMPSVASMERTPAIEVVPVQPASQSMDSQPVIEFTAPVAQVSVELRAPITMPGIVAPEIRTLRKPRSPSESPPMSEPVAIASALNQPSGAALRPAAPGRTNPWMWIAIAVIVVGGAVGTILALQ